MLTPEYLQDATDGAEKIASQMHRNIMDKIIARMMSRIGRGEDYLLTATDKWQIMVLQDAGELLKDIQKEITDKTKKQLPEIKAAFQDAGIEALKWDHAIYEAVGLNPPPLAQSPALIRILERDYAATEKMWRNFTRTTAEESQRIFINEMDNAYRNVVSGAVSYTEAVKEVLDKVTENGVKVTYPTQRKLSIEAATMMIVRTGIGQAAADISIKRMEEMEWDTILVSAHLGARTGDGGMNPTNHLWWQGRFYSRTGKDKRYPDFRETTGYGTGEGLCGWNCRHSFGTGDGINNPFDIDSIKKADNYKAESLQKRQRTLERRIRNSKGDLQNIQTAIDSCRDEKLKFELHQMYDRKSAVLRRQNKQYRDYCKENDLKEYSERLRVAQWDRSQAVKSAKAAQRYLNAKGDEK
jgi:hypothetical protein